MIRDVPTPYGPMTGCPDCGIIKLHGDPYICEHGVAPALPIEVSVTMHLEGDAYHRLFGVSA